MNIVTTWTLAAVCAVALVPQLAAAQDSRLSISVTPAVAASAGDSQLAVAGAVGYRFGSHFTFEGEVTWIDAAAGGVRDGNFNFDPRVSAATTVAAVRQNVNTMFGGNNGRNPGGITNTPNRPGLGSNINIGQIGGGNTRLAGSTNGDTWIGTMGVRYEPTVQTARFRPYLSGGLGVNHTSQSVSLTGTGNQAIRDSLSYDGIAFSAGGGANVHLGGPLWIGADAKYFRLSRHRDLMRLGGGFTVKF